MRQITLMLNYILLACMGLICFANNPTCAANQNDNDTLAVNFGYMPPEWQTAICLPDDPCKSIVDKSGDLLQHFEKVIGGSDGFRTRIRIQIADNLVWKKQQLHSPRV
ncbi:MAG: hypothetical protein ACYSWP_25875, partial [Planctomycetota bacterium]